LVNEQRKRIYALLLIMVLILLCSYYIYNRPTDVNKLSSVKNAIELSAEKIVYLEDIGIGNITCTGLTYDSKDNTFWIGDYGALEKDQIPQPKLYEVTADFLRVLRIIQLDNLEETANLQGVSYDSVNDSLWIATGKYIHEIDKKGTMIQSVKLGKYESYHSNGICYDDDDDSIWVLCYSMYLLHYDKNGNLVGTFRSNYLDQDHIMYEQGGLYLSVGADYQGPNNFIVQFIPSKRQRNIKYKLTDSYAIEGICQFGGKLIVLNDGKYHSSKIAKSYISIYDIKE